jgi:hypothetical protein
MDREVLQMLGRIPGPGITLDLWDFEFFGQAIANHPSGERGTGSLQSLSAAAALPLSFLSISQAMLAQCLSKLATFCPSCRHLLPDPSLD